MGVLQFGSGILELALERQFLPSVEGSAETKISFRERQRAVPCIASCSKLYIRLGPLVPSSHSERTCKLGSSFGAAQNTILFTEGEGDISPHYALPSTGRALAYL